jgi:hypothetical protein
MPFIFYLHEVSNDMQPLDASLELAGRAQKAQSYRKGERAPVSGVIFHPASVEIYGPSC